MRLPFIQYIICYNCEYQFYIKRNENRVLCVEKNLSKNIIIIDDHELILEGIRTILERNKSYHVIEKYMDGDSFLMDGKLNEADLILIDISMPGKNGLEIVKELRENSVDIPVIIVSQYPEEEYASMAIKSGANGYISKNANKELILKAVNTVLNGGMYISGEGVKALNNQHANSLTQAELLEKLSERENQVLVMLCKGKALKEISFELKISDRTVSTYKQRILEKLGLVNLVDLIKFGIDNKII